MFFLDKEILPKCRHHKLGSIQHCGAYLQPRRKRPTLLNAGTKSKHGFFSYHLENIHFESPFSRMSRVLLQPSLLCSLLKGGYQYSAIKFTCSREVIQDS